MLGVRESARIKGRYTASIKDITAPEIFKNTAFASDYPIDIHACSAENDTLKQSGKTYYIPDKAAKEVVENCKKIYNGDYDEKNFNYYITAPIYEVNSYNYQN